MDLFISGRCPSIFLGVTIFNHGEISYKNFSEEELGFLDKKIML
jgi:hypothetical protein